MEAMVWKDDKVVFLAECLVEKATDYAFRNKRILETRYDYG